MDDEYDPRFPTNYADVCAVRLKGKLEREHFQQEQKRRALLSHGNSVGRKILEKMGWKEGEGLGKEKKGLITPLIARKIDDRAGVIVQADRLNGTPAAVPAGAGRTMVITNIPPWPKAQLEEEIVEGAAEFGNLLNIEITEKAIYCEFESNAERNAAVANFDGRIMGGRNLRANIMH